MREFNNTNEIRVGDIILGIPKQFLFNEESEIYLRPEDKCFEINVMRDDILSFSEEIIIAKCIMIDEINNRIYLVDMKDKDIFTWDVNMTPTNYNYSSWILDLNF